jgi:hypothetical protein
MYVCLCVCVCVCLCVCCVCECVCVRGHVCVCMCVCVCVCVCVWSFCVCVVQWYSAAEQAASFFYSYPPVQRIYGLVEERILFREREMCAQSLHR